jgi:hypothetical protein
VKGEITKAIVDDDEGLSPLSSSPVATRAVIVEERNLLIKKTATNPSGAVRNGWYSQRYDPEFITGWYS